MVAVGVAPRRAHRQAVLADRDADAERRTQVDADGSHGVEQRGVFARLAGRGHPVGRQLHPRDGADAGRRQVRERLAHRHSSRRRCVDDRERRALAHRHRLAENGIEAHRGDGDIGDRHLPTTDHLIARGHAADRAVTDGDQERLVRHRRKAQDAIERLAHVEPRGVERRRTALDAFDVALRARRLAQQHLEIHVDRTIGEQWIVHDQALAGGGAAHDGIRAALAPAEGLEHRELLRIDREHIALLRFVAPDLQRRHSRRFRGHRAQVEHRTAAGAVHDLGQGIRQATRAHIVDGEDRTAGAQGAAAIDNLLATALHLRVAALHRVEVEVGAVGAGVHAGRRAATETDRHARAAELHQSCTIGDIGLERLIGADVAQAARDHDRFVEAAHAAADHLLVGAEIAGQIGTAELVVERGTADRPLDHDVERGHDAVGLATEAGLPGLPVAGNAQVRCGEAGQAGLGSRAASGCALIADLAAGAGRRAGKRGDGGRMVVGLDLHQDVRERTVRPVAAVGPRHEVRDFRALHHRRIVGVGDDRVRGRGRMRMTDHAEQRVRLRFATDDPGRIENLVAAVLGVGLREHHQFDIGRIAARGGEDADQIVDLVGRQCQAENAIGRCYRVAAAAEQVDGGDRFRNHVGEHARQRGAGIEHHLGHAVVDQGRDALLLRAGQPAGRTDAVFHPALEPRHGIEPALAGDLGGLRRPRRDGARTRRNQERQPVDRCRNGGSVFEHLLQPPAPGGVERPVELDEVDVGSGYRRHPRNGGAQRRHEFFQTKRRQRIAPAQLHQDGHETDRGAGRQS